MREIKFRAWDTQEKRYVQIFDNTIGKDWFLPNVKEKYVVEQYTGLKDKNGTEIYEGDVVKVEGDGEIYRVEWIRSGFGLEPRYNSPRYPVLGNVELCKKIEVIGNIHTEFAQNLLG